VFQKGWPCLSARMSPLRRLPFSTLSRAFSLGFQENVPQANSDNDLLMPLGVTGHGASRSGLSLLHAFDRVLQCLHLQRGEVNQANRLSPIQLLKSALKELHPNVFQSLAKPPETLCTNMSRIRNRSARGVPDDMAALCQNLM